MTTITQQQFEAAYEKYKAGCQNTDQDDFAVSLATLGITITPAEPSEAMVKLARQIASKVHGCHPDDVLTVGSGYQAALAALQHAVDVVKPIVMNERHWTRETLLDDILNALGAGGRNAG